VEALVPRPATGRTFGVSYNIRLSDADATGRLRLDAVARFLQDAATDDVGETGWGAPEHLWVLRSVRIDVQEPFLSDETVEIVTWGSSFSALAAGRRWSLVGDAGGSIEVDSTWIHLGPDARPARIGAGFDEYAEAAQGRVASTKLTLVPPATDGHRRDWPLRVTDVDRMGHVNNAAYWAAVEQRLPEVGLDPRRTLCARLDYRHPIDLGEKVELAESVHNGRFGVSFVVGDLVKAVARVDPLQEPGSSTS
jgi:acyl-ACP thioesterase